MKLPIKTLDKEQRIVNKERYLKEGEKYYPNLKSLTKEDYEILKIKFENRDEDIDNIMLKAVLPCIIESVAEIFAKYDLDDVVTFKDCVSHVLVKFNHSISNFETLPKYFSAFQTSFINNLCFNLVYKHYFKTLANQQITMPNSSIIWEIDKQNNENNVYKMAICGEIRDSLIKTMIGLKEREKRVFLLKEFGSDHKLTFEEIGIMENLSKSRICKIYQTSLIKLRNPKNIKYIKKYSDMDFKW